MHPYNLTYRERAVLRDTIHSAIYVPVFATATYWTEHTDDRPSPIGVFCLESDTDIADALRDRDLQKLLKEQTGLRLSAVIKKHAEWVDRRNR